MIVKKCNLLVTKVVPPSQKTPFLQVFAGNEIFQLGRDIVNSIISKGDLINIRLIDKKIVKVY